MPQLLVSLGFARSSPRPEDASRRASDAACSCLMRSTGSIGHNRMSLLEAVEQGILLLVGTTTENPSFTLNGALVSRSTGGPARTT